MRVKVHDKRNQLKIKTIFESFFDELAWTDSPAEMEVYRDKLIHNDTILPLDKGRELIQIYRYLEQFTPSKTKWGTLLGVRPLKLVHRLWDQGKTSDDIRFHLIENIGLHSEKASLLLEIASYQRKHYLIDRDKLSIYISLPFCPSICSYCNFHTKPYQKKYADEYLKFILDELSLVKNLMKEHQKVIDVVYIGGGTPTSMRKDALELLFDALDDLIPRKQLKELTLEAGRLDSITEDMIPTMERATRVCLNPQSLNESVLKGLNRPSGDHLNELIKHFEKRTIPVNSDLIAGLPGETLHEFIHSLERLISSKPSNITLHNLSLKRGSVFRNAKLSSEQVPHMLSQGYALLKEHHYIPYYIYRQKKMLGHGENLGYTTEGNECLYNIRMMEDAHEIIALGSNATSKYIEGDKLTRIQNVKEMTLWLRQREESKEKIRKAFRHFKAN